MQLIDKVKSRLPTLEYIRQSVTFDKLIPSGDKTRINPCPFCGHNDSATIYGDGTIYCFSSACGKSVDVVGLASFVEKIPDQFEMAKILADRYHIGNGGSSPTPAFSPPPVKESSEKKKDPWVNSDEAAQLRHWAATVYSENLFRDPAALQYQTKTRGHPSDLLAQEMVGVGLRNLIPAAKDHGIDIESLERIGLVSKDKNGRWREYVPRNAYVYPHYSNGRCLRFTLKHKKDFQIYKIYRDDHSLCWGQDALNADSFILCEGENDRLSILSAGGENVASIIGNENVKGINAYLNQNLKPHQKVYLWFDPDEAGSKYAQIFTAVCTKAGCQVHILPSQQGKDPDDMLREADDRRVLLSELCDSASIVTPPSNPGGNGGNGSGGGCSPKKWLSDEFDSFDVLCALPSRTIALFDNENRVLHEVNIKDLDQKCLSLVGGPDVSFRVVRSKDDAELIPGAILFTRFVQDIICEARSKTISNLQRVGLGIHPISDGRMLINNGPDAFVYDPSERTFTRQSYPLIKDLLINFRPNRRLVDMEAVIKRVNSMTRTSAKAIVDDFRGWVNQWGFTGLLDSDLITGWVLAQIVQKQWDWRPNLGLYGQAETGKTIFHTFISEIFGHFHLEMEGRGLTEPAFRQTISDSSRLVFIDEFEKSKHRQLIVDTLRGSSRGTTKYIGSSSGTSSPFTLKHMVLISAIEKGNAREAEASRILNVETLKDPSRKPKMPSSTEARRLRVDLIAFSLCAAPIAYQLIKKLSRKMNRSQEAIAVPFSMLSVIEPDPEQELWELIGAYLEDVADKSDETLSDSDALIDAIMASKIRVAEEIPIGMDSKTIYTELSVSSLLEYQSQGGLAPHQEAALQASGIKITPIGDIFMVPSIISRYLIDRTSWRDMAIGDILARIPNAKRTRLRVSGKICRGIIIPRSVVD